MKFKLWISLLVILGVLLIPVQFAGAVSPIYETIKYLNDLLDVNAPAPANNQALTWDTATSRWIAENVSVPFNCTALDNCNLTDLGDVNIPTPPDGYIVFWNNTAGEWQARAEDVFNCTDLDSCNISDLGNVNTSSLVAGDILYWNNTAGEWQNKAESIFNCTALDDCNLTDLGDVNATAPVDDTFLYWDNGEGKWQSRLLIAGDIPNLDASKITTGIFTMPRLPTEAKLVSITFIIDGLGTTISVGQKGHLEIPFNCTVQRVTMSADQTGSIIIDIWKDTYANFPPTNADSITSATPPTITTAQKSQDSTLTNWTTTINAGDILAYNVDNCTNITRITVSLKAVKT